MRSVTTFLALLLAMTLAVMLPVAVPAQEGADEPESKLAAGTFSGLELRAIGPALMSGRIADLAIHPEDQSVWYVAVGSGGVWKTENAGTTFAPIFDNEGSYSIGCVTLDPSRPETVWVGTGENVGGRHVGYGDGVYKSLDGGRSWRNMGLADSQHIGSIVVDPRDSNVVFVASQGPLWSSGGDRGLFKTTDGGDTWEQVLGGGELTGVNEVVMDPENPDVLYASTHQRLRTVAALMNGGPESGIHKSVDGGATWRRLENGLPKGDLGKIGLAVSFQNPNVVYATIEVNRREGGFYRSADGGASWEKRNDYFSGGTGPHYYQEIFASPHHFDRVYQMDASSRFTTDGGKTFERLPEEWKHGDSHAMAFDPNDPNYLMVGSDGGLYESWDLGASWKFVTNLPLTQFYKVAVDYDLPFYNVYGGTQDNNTQGGPSRTDTTSGIRSSDWFITLFADGHQPAVDPTNPDIVYSEWQQGNPVRYDRKTGEIVYIQPQPEPGDPPERFNWDAPILISPHDPATIFYASQRVWRSDDRGDSWRPISGDLTRNIDRLRQPMMGRVWSIDAAWDLTAMSNFSTLTSLSQSPIDAGVLWAGTDDGLVQVTTDGGDTWTKIDGLPGVAEHAFVNDIKADLHDAATAYVALDDHKTGDFAPYLLKTTDRGASWTSIAGDLPERHLVWRVVQDPVKPDLLFAGTEFGVFFTLDGGGRWIELSGGVPNIPFRDLVIQTRENDLVGATFGRGFYILDDYTPLRHISEAALEAPATLFPVKDAWWYIPRRPLGRGEKATQGADFFTAPNPPFGAVFTYYLGEGLETRKGMRQKAEAKVAKEGGDTPPPDWDAVRLEADEAPPAILLTVRDAAGEVVRHLTGPTQAGFHRVAWDLRYPSSAAETGDEPGGRGGNPFAAIGPLAAPGTYSVHMAQQVDGMVTELGQAQTFEVVPLPGREMTLEGVSPSELTRFLRQLGEARGTLSAARAKIRETAERLQLIQEALLRSTADVALGETARQLERRLGDLEIELGGNPHMGRMGEPEVPSIQRRLQVVQTGTSLSTYGPTPTHRRSFELAQQGLVEVGEALSQITDVELPALEERLDAAGVPWTPGRRVPAPPGE